MRKLILTLTTMLALGIGASAASGAVAPSELAGQSRIKPDLTYNGAVSEAVSDAYFFWSGEGTTVNNFCNGPYENVRHKTQWACYGTFTSPGGHSPYWQVNLDPYGEVTYHHKAY